VSVTVKQEDKSKEELVMSQSAANGTNENAYSLYSSMDKPGNNDKATRKGPSMAIKEQAIPA
jgi:hypothetical protein